MFRPFSSEKAGAVTTGKTTMILMSEEQSSPVASEYTEDIFVCHLFYRCFLFYLPTYYMQNTHTACSLICFYNRISTLYRL